MRRNFIVLKEVIYIDNPIKALAEVIIGNAFRNHATDIHIIPHEHHALIKLRIGNKLLPLLNLRQEDCERLISHFKFSALMDIGEKRRPQSGSFSYFLKEQKIGLRLSTLPTRYDESMVIRLIPEHNQLPLSEISLFPAMTNKIVSLIKQAHGMVILTGPTGSGKTTTLYSLLNGAAKMIHRNVITLEDPIERMSDSYLQVQVNEKAGVTYTTGLKAILRHDPDIIMVGEIRDAETARIAVRAALTGHLVLSTMHTRDSKGAIHRLKEFGVDWSEMEQTLIAVTAQRLVELTCPFCHLECSPFCESIGRRKRASVFELLSGNALSAALIEAKGGAVCTHYPTLRDIIRKGVALGFIKESEFERWILNETATQLNVKGSSSTA